VSFTVPAYDTYRVEVLNASISGKVGISLFVDQDGLGHYMTDDDGVDPTKVGWTIPTGYTYYVRVWSLDGSMLTYKLKLSLESPPADAYEPADNDPATAQVIPYGAANVQDHTFTDTDHNDYIRYEIPTSPLTRAYALEILPPVSSIFMRDLGFSADGLRPVKDNTVYEDPAVAIQNVPYGGINYPILYINNSLFNGAAGTYSSVLMNNSGNTGAYRVRLVPGPDEWDKNSQGYNDSTWPSGGSVQYGYVVANDPAQWRSIYSTDDVDFISFSATTAAVYTVATVPDTTDGIQTVWEVHNSSGTLVAGPFGGSVAFSIGTVGTYYIKVSRAAFESPDIQTGGYTVRVTK
jgi:hypothetical protein